MTTNTTNTATTPTGHHPELDQLPGHAMTRYAARALAVLRVATGFVFLWAFLDKTFGWHYATIGDAAWIKGGSPTEGFLSHVETGPFQSWFRSIAGTGWADWLFMLGLLGIGTALITGIAVRAAALAGVALMTFMWLAEFPFAQTDSTGTPTGSTNPLTDYHLIYAIVLVVLALTYSGTTWGLGKWWARQPYVSTHRWAL